MASRYRMQVFDTTTREVVSSWPPGLDDERDFITDVVKRVRAHSVGFLTREADVLNAVREALESGIREMKERVR